MTDLDILKQVWQGPPGLPASHPIGREELLRMIRARTAEIKQRTVERVRAESYNYLAMTVIPVLMLLGTRGLTLRAALESLGVLALLGPILGVLAYKEYRLRTLPLGGPLKRSLETIVAGIDSTCRFYMFTYMLCVVLAVVVGEGLLVRRYGIHWIPIAAFVGGMAFVTWAYGSGRAYVRRMFGPVRIELTDCLSELDRA